MDADFDLGADGVTRKLPGNGHGGRRPGAGRPAAYSPKRAKELEAALALFGDEDEDDTPGNDHTTLSVRKARAVTSKEESVAGLKALELKVEQGKYLPRAAYREATATLLAALAQGLRSLPDQLERDFNLAPEVCERVEQVIDEALRTTALRLEVFAGDDA